MTIIDRVCVEILDKSTNAIIAHSCQQTPNGWRCGACTTFVVEAEVRAGSCWFCGGMFRYTERTLFPPPPPPIFPAPDILATFQAFSKTFDPGFPDLPGQLKFPDLPGMQPRKQDPTQQGPLDEEGKYWKMGSGEIVAIKDMKTSHIANTLNYIASRSKYIEKYYSHVQNMVEEFEKRDDITPQDINKYKNALATFEEEQKMTQTYSIRIQSPFILTPGQVKNKLGIGFHVLSVETEKDLPNVEITDVDSAVEAMVKVGFKSLARAYHPDLGGDPNKMVILNRARKELLDLLASCK